MSNDVVLKIQKTKKIEDIKKIFSFISEEVEDIKIIGDNIILSLSPEVDKNKVLKKCMKVLNKSVSVDDKEEIIFKLSIEDLRYTSIEKMEEEGIIKKYGDGLIGFSGIAIKVFNYFSYAFKMIAINQGAEERIYPTLLGLGIYNDTGYLKNSPQHAMFCCDVKEDIEYITKIQQKVREHDLKSYLKEPEFSLSPSACFHTYYDFSNQTLDTNKIVTFMQKVFRNEGRFSWDEQGRLRDYHIREIVLIGENEFVNKKREKILVKIIELLKLLELDCSILSASDMFVVPDFQRYKELQISEKSKYEVRLSITGNKDIAGASLNLHGLSFANAFEIRLKSRERVVTGCVGFGIDRWVLAFLAQYGNDMAKWPNKIKRILKDF